MQEKNRKQFKRSFPYYDAMSVEDLASALEDSLFEMNSLLEALSYKQGVDVFLECADSDSIDKSDTCFGVSISVRTNTTGWDWNGSEMEEI